MINVEERHLRIIKSILKKYNYSFFVFGSRITQHAKKFSDLDLLYFDDIPSCVVMKIEEDFEESDLPYKVDLVDYKKCDEDFHKIIGTHYECIQVAGIP